MRRFIFAILAIASFSATGAGYVDSLRSRYEGRIGYVSSKAAEIVKAFNIDCRRDDRFLRLEHLLLARLREGDGENAWLTMRIDSRDNEVRIYDQVQYKAGGFGKERLVFEISKWNQLRPVGLSIEAVLSACIGSAGPIWTETNMPAPTPSVWVGALNSPRGIDQCAAMKGGDDVIEARDKFKKILATDSTKDSIGMFGREGKNEVAAVLRTRSGENSRGVWYVIIASNEHYCNEVRRKNLAAHFKEINGSD